MDMTVARVTWCPAAYVLWSLVALIVSPLVVIPLMASRRAWRSAAPFILALIPVLHAITMAFLGFRDALRGIALSGVSARERLPGQLSWTSSVFTAAATVSVAIAVIGLLILLLRRKTLSEFGTFGEAFATGLAISGGVLLLVFLTVAGVSFQGWLFDVVALYYLATAGAWMAATLSAVGALGLLWLISSARGREAPATLQWHKRRLYAAALIAAGVGVTMFGFSVLSGVNFYSH